MRLRIPSLRLQVSLRTRFALGLGVVLLPFLLAAAVGQHYLLPRLIGPLEEIVYEMVEEMRPVVALEIALLKAGHTGHDYLILGNPSARKVFERSIDRVEQIFVAVSPQRFHAGEERELIRAAHAEWELARNLAETLLRLPHPAGNAAAIRDMQEFESHIDRITDVLEKMQAHFDREIGEERVKSTVARQQAMFLTAVVLAVALGVALAVGTLLGSYVLGSVDALRSVARRLEEGDLAARVALERKDELGGLARAFNTMVEKLEQNEAALHELAIRDGLTGLYNHRRFYVLLEDELARARRFRRPVSLLLLDIDHFKRVNDTYGHQAGDAVLRGLGELLGREARAIDRVCRYGGEEITIILPETDLEAAANFAERLRTAVEAQLFETDVSAPVRITVSIGIASWPLHADNAQALIAAADTAMYAAKQGGRNLAICYEPLFGQTRERG